MAVSFTFVGILIMVDVLFLVNYVAVKWIRAWTDQREEQLAADRDLRTMLRGVGEQLSTRSLSPRMRNIFNFSDRPNLALVYSQAIFMDVVHRDLNSVQRFEKWRELPFACGKWSTVLLVLFCFFFLSADFLAKDSIFGGVQASTHICYTTDFDEKIDNFKSQMISEANMDMAQKQYYWTEGFYEALVADTELYGTDGYECASVNGVSGYKDYWSENSDESFFPGYCVAMKEEEISSAKQTTCPRTKCECATLMGTSIRACWLAKICVDVEVSCPANTGDQEAELEEYYSESDALVYDEEQTKANLTQALPSISDQVSTTAANTIRKIMHQVDVASLLYSIYSLVALFFPTPMLMFRLPYSLYIKRYLFGIYKTTFILSVVALWWGIEYFHPIWMNPDIRLYLKMLRIGDPCLFDANFLLEKLYVIKDICQDLITMKAQFSTSTSAINRISAEVGFFVNSCNCSFPNVNLIYFQTPEYIFRAEAEQLGFVREMDGLCESPYCNRIFLPAQNNSFLGDMSMCRDISLAREYLLTDGARTNWWQIWIGTGILAQLLLKVVVTNFCIALYRLADPLSSCGGRFEWPPKYLFRVNSEDSTAPRHRCSSTGMPVSMAMELRERKTTSLRIIAFKWVLLWGILSQLCLFNLALAPVENDSVRMMTSTDALVFIFCLSLAAIAVAVLFGLRYLLQRNGFDDNMKPIVVSGHHGKEGAAGIFRSSTPETSSGDQRDNSRRSDIKQESGEPVKETGGVLI